MSKIHGAGRQYGTCRALLAIELSLHDRKALYSSAEKKPYFTLIIASLPMMRDHHIHIGVAVGSSMGHAESRAINSYSFGVGRRATCLPKCTSDCSTTKTRHDGLETECGTRRR